MFGSEIVATLVYQELITLPEVQAAVDDRLVSIEIVPQDVALPAGLFHPTSSTYGGSIFGGSTEETLGYTIRFICEGISTDPVWEAAQAQHRHFDGEVFDITVKGENYRVSFTASGESIPTTVYEGGVYYRLLGTAYDVHITKG